MGEALRRAHGLVLAWSGSGLVGFHYPERRRRALSPLDVALLSAAAAWTPRERLLAAAARPVDDPSGRDALAGLVAGGLLVTRGSEAARRDEALRGRWPWGHEAALLHFAVRDTAYVAPARAAALAAERAARTPAVPLAYTNDAFREVVTLPPPDFADPFYGVLRRRRSRRAFGPEPLPLAALARCLAAGLAITDLARAGGELLPLKPAPSGGARNPFEGYVVARNVAGLGPGVYHYGGLDHTLGRLAAALPPAFSALLGGQAWMDDAAAVVLLVATLARAARKYTHPGAYRVVLLEAGHLAQNLLLAATREELRAVPTCALAETACERLLGIDDPARAVLYAVALGTPGDRPSAADFREVVPNPSFPA